MEQNQLNPPRLKPRLFYIDLLKAFTVFCVLWGHAIQQFDNTLDWFHCTQNPVFGFIYMFHMPLFFVISGFFWKPSLKLSPLEFLSKKAVRLLLPWLVWCVIIYAFNNIGRNPFRNSGMGGILMGVFYNGWFWFLREMFLCWLLAYLSYRLVKKGPLAALLCLVLIFVVPVEWSRQQRVYLPMFFLGIWSKENHEFIIKRVWFFMFGSLVVAAACVPFWDAYLYDTAAEIFSWKAMNFSFSNIRIYLFREIAGASSSVFFFTLFQKFHSSNRTSFALSRIGVFTMEIYILQVLIIEHILTVLIDFPNMNEWIYSRLVQQPGWLLNKSCNFSPSNQKINNFSIARLQNCGIL